ncbi:MAG: fumarylacetoacetate hydrolase family protein [Sedimenticola sp.]
MKSYCHQRASGAPWDLPLGKIVCVGRNYADHAKELNNPIPKQPLLFIKPATAAVPMVEPIVIPYDQGECHHELEMALLVGRELKDADPADIPAAILAIGLGLDLTLRDVQSRLKEKGQPWERAKAFDASCPLSEFVEPAGIDLNNLSLQLYRNDRLQQSGNTQDMLFSPALLLADISRVFTLLPGDVVMTGTPAGVGPLLSGDRLRAELGDVLSVETTVA